MNGMTGYSYKEYTYDDVYISTEIKTVNSRFLDMNVSLPYYLNSMELNVRNIIKQNISRGKVDANVYLKPNENMSNVSVDHKLAKKYVEGFRGLISEFNLKDDVRLFHLTKYDDIIHIEKKRDYSKYWKLISKSLMENINETNSMRRQEGKALEKDLTFLNKKIKNNLDIINKKVPKMEKDIHNTTLSKIKEFIGNNVDEIRLLNEVAILVNRSCINEEIKRLESHLKQFAIITKEKNDIGKRLDFICQEMHREINTIGSKVSLVELTGNVISIKNDIEKMREQIRNIE